MSHYRVQEWQEYVCGSIDADVAVAMERHLIQCEICLELYLMDAENSLWGEVSSQFTDAVMAKLPEEAVTEEKQKPVASAHPRFFKQSMGNYAIAACLTLLLTAGGIFGDVASAVPQLKGLEISFADKAAQKVSSGWSEDVAEKTLSILDIVKPD